MHNIRVQMENWSQAPRLNPELPQVQSYEEMWNYYKIRAIPPYLFVKMLLMWRPSHSPYGSSTGSRSSNTENSCCWSTGYTSHSISRSSHSWWSWSSSDVSFSRRNGSRGTDGFPHTRDNICRSRTGWRSANALGTTSLQGASRYTGRRSTVATTPCRTQGWSAWHGTQHSRLVDNYRRIDTFHRF